MKNIEAASISFISASLICFFIFLSSFAAAFAGGDGSLSNPYQINNCTALNDTRKDLFANYTLINDIDCSDTVNWDGGAGFNPIGDSINNFVGAFDGKTFKIINLTINFADANNVGLFGYIYGASITNISLINANIGGFEAVGILVGRADSSTISNSYSTGVVSGNGNYAGILVGRADSSTISNSYSTGIISGSGGVGGLVGYASPSAQISNSFSSGNVSGNTAVGGLVGYASSSVILDSYSIGTASGISFTGGLVGLHFDAVCTDIFWDNETSGQLSDGCPSGSTPETTAQMKTESTFTGAGWNFTSIWGISPNLNNNYPYLRFFYNAKYDSFTGTDFNSLTDVTNVSNAQLAQSGSTVKWNSNINAAGADFDSNAAFGFGFVSFNVSEFDSTINSSANVTIAVSSCVGFNLYYSAGYYNTMGDIKNNGIIVATSANVGGDCTDPSICTNVRCSANSLTFTAQHFDGYGVDNPAVPEFSAMTTIIALGIVLSGFLFLRKQQL